MHAIEGGQSTSVEICKINPEIARDITDILSNPVEVYASFTIPEDVDVETIDPLDLQAFHIAKLQTQRRELLEELHLMDVADSMRQPRMYFEAITSSFFDQCGADRLVWGRARPFDGGVAETAHTGTYRRDKFDIVEPEIHGRITYVTPADEPRSLAGVIPPRSYELVTDLQNTQPGIHYRFYTSERPLPYAQDGLVVEKITSYGTSDATYTPVTDVVDRFTLLQALTVDLYAAVTDMHPENDEQTRRMLALEVYGLRTPR